MGGVLSNCFDRERVLRTVEEAKSAAPAVGDLSTEMGGADKIFETVIVGGGVAAGYAAREFVRLGAAKGAVAMISREAVYPYERPALSKGFIMNKAKVPGFNVCVGSGGENQGEQWYVENGIETYLSTSVTSIAFDSKTLTTDKAGTIGYKNLILAMGARPVTLTDMKMDDAAKLKGIYTLREVEDTQPLLDALIENKGKKALCVGGGYIGLECAAAMTVMGLHVTMVFPEPHVMQRLFTPEMAALYEEVYAQKGIKMIKGTVASGFVGDSNGKVKEAHLKNGEKVPCDVVVVGVGAKPNVELCQDKLDMEARAVKVNGRFQSSIPDVYAVGDLATFPNAFLGGVSSRVEHVDHARRSAMHCVNVILGKETSDYAYLPYFYSREFDLSWKFYGQQSNETLTVRDPGANHMAAFWMEGSTVVGAFVESGTAEEESMIQALARAKPTIDVAALKAAKTVADAFAVLKPHCSM
ncbi:unnamed protein product [Vitrella brassicaformis CCMP3155]|uniref:monodehydroascorbate reductase (NADH) n=3 Tax=Vitrella brassicaformis TaxID=1169539 RepID=A0A0G4F7M2_VITBC|nr:unnamed protein product [Vitrella brassicaformis CCMP3155]|mmetsp:Transcript_39714/g.99406  ORF Transcript_39714/g.99406 Transcript_39714/m.99406 type:complete len:470 (+) Transcript_39714:65-1474(+)|eukprot:CEM08681.1 unnamed protein product [Vitrella brassicaformis CCMP3155]